MASGDASTDAKVSRKDVFSIIPAKPGRRSLAATPYKVTLEKVHIADKIDLLTPELAKVMERHLEVALAEVSYLCAETRGGGAARPR